MVKESSQGKAKEKKKSNKQNTAEKASSNDRGSEKSS